MDRPATQLHYEIRHHATGAISSDTSPSPSVPDPTTAPLTGLLSSLSIPGVSLLKDRWKNYHRPTISNTRPSLFVSRTGEYVAVAVQNRIIILRKDDDYSDPCGVFHNKTIFTNGAWSEPLGVLGLVDEMGSVYFIRSDGEEVSRLTRSQLKVSSRILHLIGLDHLNAEYGFGILTGDGSFCHVEVNQRVSLIPTLSNQLKQKLEFPRNISCIDVHLDPSLIVLVGAGSGLYSLCLVRIGTSLELEVVFCSPSFEGIFSFPKGRSDSLVSPKVAVSSKGEYIASLDMTGCLDIFKLDADRGSLSVLTLAERKSPQESDNQLAKRTTFLNDIDDFTWWADHILVLAKRSGCITLYDVVSWTRVVEKEPVFCMPVIERVKGRQRYTFVLESKSLRGRSSIPRHEEYTDMIHSKNTPSAVSENTVGLNWSLMSFAERSVSEMYNVLISNQQYEDALEFADQHGLDKDEIFKAQWLSSEQGTYEANMFLSKIKDNMFVISECVSTVGPTEDTVKFLISYGLQVTDQYKFSVSDDGEPSFIWDLRMLRLQLLQFKDRLETFMGINMGRFSTKEYSKFRLVPLTETAIGLAESGKIGALNLLFNRHPYSLSPSMLEILSAIPETIPAQTYGRLLPGRSPTSTPALREGDWVECEKMVSFIDKLPGRSDKGHLLGTEYILEQCIGFVWPSVTELSEWYKNRARDMDNLSGQLDNCLSLMSIACDKGIVELRQFLEDISILHQLIYSDECEGDFTMSLVTWEHLSDYEKFRMMLKGVKTEKVVERLQVRAIPFMQKRCSSEALNAISQMKDGGCAVHCEWAESFLVRWLKEVAADNKLDICLAVIENACADSPATGLFKNEAEKVETTLECIYLCTLTDKWNVMASLLSKLPRKISRDDYRNDINPKHGKQGSRTSRLSLMKTQPLKSETQTNSTGLHEGDPEFFVGFDDHIHDFDKLEKRIKVAEDHVETGRLLAYYQVPKQMKFFLDAQSDEKNVKQLLRLILSKFARRQPGRSDTDWANMWRDMQAFQEKAFPFLDVEFMLVEFVRGLLKAGKFSLARNYLKGTATVALATEKAESLVIQAAREYFFSASSLDCTEIWKAKECLSLFPHSNNVQAEAGIIDALTVRLPKLGVTVLPMEFRQKKNPMEIINTVIARQRGGYLDVEELIEISKLLGLSSQDDIALIEETVAQEAFDAGDMQMAFDLCLTLVKKGHGQIWKLCASIANGPHLENMETSSRKQLLGFALSHCDEKSIGTYLHDWNDIDRRIQYEHLITSTGTCPPNFSVHGSSAIPLPLHSVQDILDLTETSENVSGALHEGGNEDHVQFECIKDILSRVGKDLPTENGSNWDSLLKGNMTALSFCALELPWLLELSGKEEYGKSAFTGRKALLRKCNISIRTQALIDILSGLAENNIAPSDDLIISLAKSVMESPVTEEDDVLGCSYLLNLTDAFLGAEIIEEQLKQREEYGEVHNIMNIGMTYSSLHNSLKECTSAEHRRYLLLRKFHEKHMPFSSDEMNHIDRVQSTFWREWKKKLEEQRLIADQARMLEQIIPGTETARFLAGDVEYIKGTIFSFIDSSKNERKSILKNAVKLADTYGLCRDEVLLRFFGCALVSDHWGNGDILAEIQDFREDIVRCAKGVVDMVRSVVYPKIDGQNKQRLSYIYSILSACFLRLRATEPELTIHWQQGHKHSLEPTQFYKTLERQCQMVSFISEMNFKNIAGLDELNFEQFNQEICSNIHDSTVDIVADMVQSLVTIYRNPQEIGLISSQDVFKYHVLSYLASLESGFEARSNDTNLDELQSIIQEIELSYDVCKKYVRALSEVDTAKILGKFFTLCVPCNLVGMLPCDPALKDIMVMILNFWIRVVDGVQESLRDEASESRLVCFDSLARCFKVFKKIVVENEISAIQGWNSLAGYVKLGLVSGLTGGVTYFLEAMILSGCWYRSVAQVYHEVESRSSKLDSLLDLYVSLTERVLLDLSEGCDEHQDLHHLLSSLSRLDGNEMDLKMIRCQVWRKLGTVSGNMQLENHVRVYALEVMQSISESGSVTVVEPWEAWDVSCCSDIGSSSEQPDLSSSITNNLVALKSSRLIANISADLRINPEDLVSLDSAVSCFLRLCNTPTTKENIAVLRAILDGWEQLYPTKIDEEKAGESHDEGDNWSSDEWGEGWESPSEDLVDRKGKQDLSIHVCSLHRCWMELILKHVAICEPGSVMELLDWSLSNPWILIDEDEARSLFQLVSEKDCFMALKMLLMLPYESLRLQGLGVVESKLGNAAGFLRPVDDYDLLTLLLSSGVLQIIANDPAFSRLLSYLFSLVGRLARVCQEELLKYCKDSRSRPSENQSVLFSRVLLPCFVSELVKAGQYFLAGFIVSRWMHTPASLDLMDIIEACLRRYLEGLVLQTQLQDSGDGDLRLGPSGPLVNTVSGLRGKVTSMLQSALLVLPTSTCT